MKYQDRPTQCIGLYEEANFCMKCYSITAATNCEANESEWNKARRLFLQLTIQFPQAEYLGYLIFHKGADSNYIVISWWSQENMLRMFAYSSKIEGETHYSQVSDGLNICVWDMQVHAFERDAYVKYILEPDLPEVPNYKNSRYAD